MKNELFLICCEIFYDYFAAIWHYVIRNGNCAIIKNACHFGGTTGWIPESPRLGRETQSSPLLRGIQKCNGATLNAHETQSKRKKKKRDSENKRKMTFKLSRQDASLSQDVGCTNYYLLIGISSCFLHSLLLPIFKFVLFRFCRNFTCGFVYNDMSKETRHAVVEIIYLAKILKRD